MTTLVNTKSDLVSNQDLPVANSPRILNGQIVNGGMGRHKAASVAFGASESNNSVYRLFSIGSRDRISSLKLVADAMTGLSAIDVGLYDTAANGSAVVSQHLFEQDFDISAGLTTPREERYQALAAASMEEAVWQLLGLSSDPGKDYDVAITATTRGAATGTIAGELVYISP
jgi:hypothetical protein